MASPRRRLLPHPEISGCARSDARAFDLVQMGKLRDMAVRCRYARRGLLGRGRAVPDRSEQGRYQHLHRHSDLCRVACTWLDNLRPAMQIPIGRTTHDVDDSTFRSADRDVMGVQPNLHWAGCAAAPWRIHSDNHDGECVLYHHAQSTDCCGRPQSWTHTRHQIRQNRQTEIDAQ